MMDFLYGGSRQREAARTPQLPPSVRAYAAPVPSEGRTFGGSPNLSINAGTGHGTTFCVRLCDGRYFPMQRTSGATPTEICGKLCPAAGTTVFYGGSIDDASAPKVGRYTDLDNAFVYRTKVVSNCSCNGRGSFGLASIDAKDDPTLRPGDMVATADGLVKFSGSRTAQFTPVSSAAVAIGRSRVKLAQD